MLVFMGMQDVVLEGHWGASILCSSLLAQEPKTENNLLKFFSNCPALLLQCPLLDDTTSAERGVTDVSVCLAGRDSVFHLALRLHLGQRGPRVPAGGPGTGCTRLLSCALGGGRDIQFLADGLRVSERMCLFCACWFCLCS